MKSFKQFYKNLAVSLGLVVALAGSYVCGDNSSEPNPNGDEIVQVDSGHKDIGLEDKLVYPDANDDVPIFDAGMDAGLDSAVDANLNDVLDAGHDSGFDAQYLDANGDVPQYDAGEDGGTDACCDDSLDSEYDTGFLDGNDDIISYDASLDASLDGSVDSGCDSGLDGSVADAGSIACDNLYPADFVIPAVYNMKIPLTDFLKYFSTITGIDKMKNLESQITSDILLQAVPIDASSMYEIISGNVLFETDSGICEMDFVKDEVNNTYQGEYNK